MTNVPLTQPQIRALLAAIGEVTAGEMQDDHGWTEPAKRALYNAKDRLHAALPKER